MHVTHAQVCDPRLHHPHTYIHVPTHLYPCTREQTYVVRGSTHVSTDTCVCAHIINTQSCVFLMHNSYAKERERIHLHRTVFQRNSFIAHIHYLAKCHTHR